MTEGIKTGSSSLTDIDSALQDISKQLIQDNISLVILYFSTCYLSDQPTSNGFDHLNISLQQHFPDTTVIGCTTAGEIGCQGYQQHSISAISLSADYFQISYTLYPNLSNLELKHWRDNTVKLHSQHNSHYQLDDDSNTFSLLLVDGMSGHEEPLVRVLANAISGIPLIGGSAGDDLQYDKAFVLHQGQIFNNSAILALITTSLPFQIVKSQNIRASDKRMVVTEAIPEQRTITEINGRPAALEYARHLGVTDCEQITIETLAAHPAVVVMGDAEYVRSIQRVNPDNSLTFYCAIDVGIVIRIGYSIDLVQSLEQTLNQVREDITPIQGMILFDCILRRVELQEKQLLKQASELLIGHRCVGFSTYGEQINGLHVNQTCTGIAIGYPHNPQQRGLFSAPFESKDNPEDNIRNKNTQFKRSKSTQENGELGQSELERREQDRNSSFANSANRV